MSQLVKEKCVACRSDVPHITEQEIKGLKLQIPEWQLRETDGVKRLEKSFCFRNFAEALAFTNQIGELAEKAGHHPRLTTEWGRVTATWWTHKIKGLHRNDFIMASKTNHLHQLMVEDLRAA